MKRYRQQPRNRFAATTVPVVLALLAVGCSENGSVTDAPNGDTPHIVVTTDIIGDVVSNMADHAATVEVVMPRGASPHDFRPSAKQAAAIRSADVLVTNGGGFEAGLTDTIDAAEADGVIVCTAMDGVDTLPARPDGSGVDPHFFTDPSRMADAVGHLSECITSALDEPDTSGVFARNAAAYRDELNALDDEVETVLEVVPEDRRLLVTNHEVFDYFADRYDFTVIGAIIPSTSSQSQADAASMGELSRLVREAKVPAIFADTSSPGDLADALAAEAGEVEVVELHTESLGTDGAATYVGMVRTNAGLIAEALG